MKRPRQRTSVRALGRRDVLGAGIAGAASLVLTEACGGTGATTDAGAEPDARQTGPHGTYVDGGGSCMQTNFTLPIAIGMAGISARGTSIEVSDARYVDPYCMNHKILLVHPTTGEAYVALSASCTHICCSSSALGGPTYRAMLRANGKVLHDVLECTCHGSIFDALTGSVVRGPATQALEVLKTCEGGGYVFIDIPQR